jgi:sulfoxide reductase heme-binding subunit YedZ
MSASYTWVGWNRQKKIYDAVVASGVALYLATFITLGRLLFRPPHELSDEILLLRALGTCAIVMLHIVLSIGPLARLDRRFLPLLYNRRHLGVATFLVAASHAVASLLQYHGFGNVNPLVSLLASNTNYLSLTAFPFEILGLLALVILFLMAATSHDFWLKNLSPRAWKSLHMLVYACYALVVMHVALGALQSERSIVYPVLLGAGIVLVGSLHLMAGALETTRDTRAPAPPTGTNEFIDICSIDDIPEKRARNVCLKGRERIAVFKYDGQVSAVSSVCEHQGGPLAEGKIIDGCITCPWHGYQYLPASGQSPPPFTEKINTYRVTIRGRRILLDPNPLPKGTPVEPARVQPALAGARP